MLARCVNESCKRPLYSFSEGRLFQFEVVSISLAASDDGSAPFDEKPQRETVPFLALRGLRLNHEPGARAGEGFEAGIARAAKRGDYGTIVAEGGFFSDEAMLSLQAKSLARSHRESVTEFSARFTLLFLPTSFFY